MSHSVSRLIKALVDLKRLFSSKSFKLVGFFFFILVLYLLQVKFKRNSRLYILNSIHFFLTLFLIGHLEKTLSLLCKHVHSFLPQNCVVCVR